MNKKITLQNNYGKLDDRLPFLMADNEKLALTFFSDIQLMDVFFIAKNGETEIKHRLSQLTTIDVPQNLIKAGALFIAVQVVARGEVVKTYEVEPIIIKDEGCGFKGFLEVEQAIEQYDTLSAKYEALLARVEKLETIEKRVHDLEMIIEQGEI